MSSNKPIQGPLNEFRLTPNDDEGDQANDLEFKLAALEVEEKRPAPLPLPDQDRVEMAKRMQQNRWKKFSIAELLGLTVFVAIVFGLASILPLDLLSLLLGLATFAGLVATRLLGWSERKMWMAFCAIFFAYLISIVAMLAKFYFWPESGRVFLAGSAMLGV